jgi:hypothetical protein
MNLIAILETGKDLTGKEYPVITESAEKMNFIILPCANPDGRARMPLTCMAGLDNHSFRYLAQGTWKDGSLCDFPACMTVHPIVEKVDFLGTYFNDDGININNDFYFTNPAAETKAILQTAENYAPDITIHFHGGGNTVPHFAPTGFLFQQVKEKIAEFQRFEVNHFKHEGLSLSIDRREPASFDLTAAIVHVCGEPALLFESNQNLDHLDEKQPWLVKYSFDEIYRHHLVLLEGLCKFVSEKRDH